MAFKRTVFNHNEKVDIGIRSLADPVSDDDIEIPKPRGEVGRLSRGGYNLQSALGWTDNLYTEVLVSIILFFVSHTRLLVNRASSMVLPSST